MKATLSLLALALALTACATEQKPPEKTWNVKVSTGGAKTWVSKADGSRQCEKNTVVVSPESALQELKSAGVMTYQARTGHDGMMHTAVCGSSTGATVDVEISRADLPKAQALGYKLPKTQKE